MFTSSSNNRIVCGIAVQCESHVTSEGSKSNGGFSTLVLQATRTHRATSPAIDVARQALSGAIDTRERFRHLPDVIWSGYCQW